MRLPLVDIIIPHLNDHDRLALCLDSVKRQNYPADCITVTVVDNGSDQPLDAVLARFPGVRGMLETRRGCGSARNHGVAASSGTILAFTDSDCRPEPDWLIKGVPLLGEGTGIDIVGGDVKVFAADETNPTDAELYDEVFGFECRRYVRFKHFACGANIIVPRRVFEAVGPFRDGRLPEDLEWGRRATRLGYRIAFGAEARVRHPARTSFAELNKKNERTVWHARNHMAEGRAFRLKWAAYTLAMASPPLIKTVMVLTSPALKGSGQRWRVFKTLLRVRYGRAAAMARYLFAPIPAANDSSTKE
ncbi:MAG: glycosyltransferase [Magnetospirillum sp.]|nr:glycosyltransferase [Magnetospirillum sp.]